MSNFKSLKFETRTNAEKMQIEEMVLSKMGKWKYSPDQIAPHITSELLTRIQLRWDVVVKNVKYIYEQSLRQLLSSLTDVEVKGALKNNEDKMTI